MLEIVTGSSHCAAELSLFSVVFLTPSITPEVLEVTLVVDRREVWQRSVAPGKGNPKARMVGSDSLRQCVDSLGR